VDKPSDRIWEKTTRDHSTEEMALNLKIRGRKTELSCSSSSGSDGGGGGGGNGVS